MRRLAPVAAVGLLLPPQTLLALLGRLAGFVRAYVVEQWVRQHRRAGNPVALGLTSGAWDVAGTKRRGARA